MIIDQPCVSQIPQLRSLWQEAFGDTEAFLDIFFHRGFSPQRSRCITRDGCVVAALYWFECRWENKRLAYLYAVATAKSSQGQGMCRRLMEDTHRHLTALGYDGVILVPGSKELFSLYEKLGYKTSCYTHSFSCRAGDKTIPLCPVDAAEYALARRQLLPKNGVVQEGATLDFLSVWADLYTGPGIAFAAYPDKDDLIVCELLGSPEKAPQILATLGFSQGFFRVPGQEMPFAMYRSLRNDPEMPGYFGLALN